MAKTFFSKKAIISAIILFAGLFIVFGVFTILNFNIVKPSVASVSLEWTQNSGAGISVPACSSASAATSCSGGSALITLNWSYGGQHGACAYANIRVGTNTISNKTCSGSYTFSGLSANTGYSWEVDFYQQDYFCAFVCFPSGFSLIDSVSGNITTPVCSVPTVSLWVDQNPVSYGQGTSLHWSSTNATSCTASGDWSGGRPTSGGPEGTGGLTSPRTYNMTCTGPGGSGSASVTVNIIPTASISASPSTISYGGSSTLSWSSTNATSCSIDQGIGGVSTSGSRAVSPAITTTYTLTCSGAGGSGQSSATVTVNLGDFTLNLNGAAACNSVPLSWTASGGAAAYRILKGNPRVDISPYQPYTSLNFADTTVSQNTTYQYQIEAYNGGSTNRSNTINITTPYCPPTISFSGSPTSIYQGQSTTLTWSSTFATSCTASGAWSGSKAVNGSEVVIPLPPPSATYTLACTGPGGSSGSQSVTVNITPLALPNWKEIIPR